MRPAEDIQRQIAVVPVIPVEEPSFLLTVHRIVRRIDIQHDARRRHRVRLDEHVYQQGVEPRFVIGHLLVPVSLGVLRPDQFQPVQRALSRQRRPAVRRPHPVFARRVPPCPPRPPPAGRAAGCHGRSDLRSPTRRPSHAGSPSPRPCARSSSDPGSPGKHSAARRHTPVHFSTARSSNAPALEVIVPPSKLATSRRRPTRGNSSWVGVHCVDKGLPPCVPEVIVDTTLYAIRAASCRYAGEKSRLAVTPRSPGQLDSLQAFRRSPVTRLPLRVRQRHDHSTPLRNGPVTGGSAPGRSRTVERRRARGTADREHGAYS